MVPAEHQFSLPVQKMGPQSYSVSEKKMLILNHSSMINIQQLNGELTLYDLTFGFLGKY